MEEKKEIENIVKITITKKSAEVLAELMDRVNHGFWAGKITRQDIASYILENSAQSFSEKQIASVRSLHYDENHMLEAAYRTMRETGEVPEFLREALKKQFQGNDESSKKSKKSLNKEYISDVLEKSEETYEGQ